MANILFKKPVQTSAKVKSKILLLINRKSGIKYKKNKPTAKSGLYWSCSYELFSAINSSSAFLLEMQTYQRGMKCAKKFHNITPPPAAWIVDIRQNESMLPNSDSIIWTLQQRLKLIRTFIVQFGDPPCCWPIVALVSCSFLANIVRCALDSVVPCLVYLCYQLVVFVRTAKWLLCVNPRELMKTPVDHRLVWHW